MTVEVLPERLELPVEGMTCSSCANRIERKLNKLDGVTATVNYATEKAAVQFDPAQASADDRIGAVKAAGYTTKLPHPPGDATGGEVVDDPPTRKLRQRLIGAAVLSIPLLLISMLPRCNFATGSGWRCSWPRRWCSGPAGRFTRPRGRTCATPPRRWTR